MIVFGLWIKHFVGQQINSKDASIQSLESVIKSKDAEISRLEKDTSPNVAAKYQQVKAFADEMAQNAIDLEKRLQAVESERKTLDTSVQKQVLTTRQDIMKQITGSFSKRFEEMMSQQKPFYGGQDLLNLLSEIIRDIQQLTDSLTPKKSDSVKP